MKNFITFCFFLGLTVSCADDSNFKGSGKTYRSADKGGDATPEPSSSFEPAVSEEPEAPQPEVIEVAEVAVATEDVQDLPELYQQNHRLTAETTQKPADIVFVVDTSGSMNDEKVAIENNLGLFMERFATAKLDSEFFIIGQGFHFGAQNSAAKVIPQRIGSKDSLTKTIPVLKAMLGTGAVPAGLASVPSMRADSAKEIVFVTDDDASGTLASDFKSFVQTENGLKDKTNTNGIVWIDGVSQASATCTRANNGGEYQKLAKDPDVGGLSLDLCQKDWAQLLDQLASHIITSLKTQVPLDQIPANAAEIVVSYEGTPLNPQDFSYDPATNAIQIKNESLQAGGTLLIEYPI